MLWLAVEKCPRRITAAGDQDPAMSLHHERIEWMPSPPLAPGDGPIDFDHLRRMTLGDTALEQEVLAMFSAQCAKLVRTLAAMPADASALAHTLKGSARAIGAFAVGDAAARLETAIAREGDPSGALAELDETVAEAQAEIEAVLRRS
jgi:HPt (histidine-containing phosphotransfer) domain-containing protein